LACSNELLHSDQIIPPIKLINISPELIAVKDYENLAFDLYRFEDIDAYKSSVDKYLSDINHRVSEAIVCKQPEQNAQKICSEAKSTMATFIFQLKQKLVADRNAELNQIKPLYVIIKACEPQARALEDQFARTKDEQEFIQSYITTYHDCLRLAEERRQKVTPPQLSEQSAEHIPDSENTLHSPENRVTKTKCNTVKNPDGCVIKRAKNTKNKVTAKVAKPRK